MSKIVEQRKLAKKKTFIDDDFIPTMGMLARRAKLAGLTDVSDKIMKFAGDIITTTNYKR